MSVRMKRKVEMSSTYSAVLRIRQGTFSVLIHNRIHGVWHIWDTGSRGIQRSRTGRMPSQARAPITYSVARYYSIDENSTAFVLDCQLNVGVDWIT
jgi:hypothetical protein